MFVDRWYFQKMILKKEDLLALNEKLNKIRKPDAE